MSNVLEDTSSSNPVQEANLGDPIDQISDLLIGEEEEEVEGNTEESLDDNEETEESTEESTEEVDESENTEENEEGELSWDSVLGIDENQLSFDDDGNLKGVVTKVNGETSVTPIADLVAGYQTNKAVTQKSQALSEDKKIFEQEKTEVSQVLKSKLDEVNAVSDYLEKQLLSDFNNIDWDGLRISNPAEYAVMRQDYSVKASELKRIKEVIGETNKEYSDAAEQERLKAEGAYVKEQYSKMLDNNPTWHDSKVFEKEMGALREFCSDTYGFTDEDFSYVKDSRVIELVKDANKYHKGAKIAESKIKKVVPKFQKSSGSGTKKVSKLSKLTNAAKKARGEQKRELQSAAVAELLTGGR